MNINSKRYQKMVERRTKITNRISDLRGIERKAAEELQKNRYGQFYEGKYEYLDRLEKIIRDARIELLELELKSKLSLHSYDVEVKNRQ